MSPHLAAKRLSAYLDDELADRELLRVEAHIAECGACRDRLHGLRLVVSELQRVPTVEPPPSLARSIETQAAMRWGPPLPGAPRPMARRAVDLLRDLIQLSAVSAGTVAIIALLIAYGSTPHPPARIPGSHAGDSEPERLAAGGRVFVWHAGAWWQRDLLNEAAAPPAPRRAEEVLTEAPWLAALLRRGPVVVELDGRIAIVDFAVSGDAGAAVPVGRNQTRAGSTASTR